MDNRLWYKMLGKEDAFDRSGYYAVNENPIKLKSLLREKAPYDAVLKSKIEGIAKLLKQFGFDEAAKDVNEKNYKIYGQWILKDLKGKIWMTDPISRKKTKWDAAEKAYDAFTKAFKSLGINEIVTPLDRKMDIHTDGNYLLRRKTTGEYYGGGNIHTPTTTMDKNKASTLTGNEIKNIKYNWPMSWDLIDLSREPDKDNMGGIRVNETTQKEYVVWGIPPNKRDEEILFTKAKSMPEAKKVCDILEKKHGVKKCRVQVLDLSTTPDFTNVFSEEKVNELAFTGELLNKVRADVLDFLGKEHKKLGYANPLDTYNMISQVLSSAKIHSQAREIR